MGIGIRELVTSRAINGWNLFWLVTTAISAAMVASMTQADLTSGPGVSSMIRLSVRCATPLLYVTFAASSLQQLFPGPFSQWLLRNRKYIGLCFAAAMAWQGFFILWMVTIHRSYYVEEVYVVRDAIEGTLGYLFLAAITVTSFRCARKRLSTRQWKWLHKIGIYYLWMYAFSVYWWALFYYSNPVPLDYVYYWSGFLAWALRAAAWSRKKHRAAEVDDPGRQAQSAYGVVGVSAIAAGFLGAGFGSAWFSAAQSLLTGYSFTRLPETYLPYWPFEPWIPVLVIALGTLLLTKARA